MKHALLLLCDLKIEDLNRWITFVTGHNFFIYIHLDISLKRQKNKILHSEQVLVYIVCLMFILEKREDSMLYFIC